MIGTRYEAYTQFHEKLPFVLHADIERTPFNGSNEQNWHEDVEIQLCTDGEGTVLLNGERYPFHPGDMVAVGSNVIHYTATERRLTYS